MTQPSRVNDSNRWKLIAYATGIAGGAAFGGLVALLYTRTAETTRTKKGVVPKINTMSMIGLSISLISLMRQIIELGRED
jgi:ABC-type Mn2+/Zn2+ transport system permease subunit